MDYQELEKHCEETKMYAKRTMDLYCDAKKWHWLAEHSSTMEDKQKYDNVADTLMDLFNAEVETMKL